VCSPSKPIYIATAGGPGACKSTIINSILQNKFKGFFPEFSNMVEVDPDQVLSYMIHSYVYRKTHRNYEKNPDDQKFFADLYNLYRGSSNFIANTVLNEAFKRGFNIAHGRTSTPLTIIELYKRLKSKDYILGLYLCGADDKIRYEAIMHRATKQASVQADLNDVVKKGEMFSKRFPIYFHYADFIGLFWTEHFQAGSVLAATYTKSEDKLVPCDEKAFDSFAHYYVPLIRDIPESLDEKERFVYTKEGFMSGELLIKKYFPHMPSE